MPAPSAAEKQKLLLQQEIAKLSGQISRHASSSQTSYHPYARGRGNFRGNNFRGRGRGRGRGSHSNVDSRSKPSTPRVDHDKDSGPEQESDWIKKTSASGNMSLMTVETKTKLEAQQRQNRTALPVLQSSSTSDGQRVLIDGVMFQFEQDGKKLTRVGETEAGTIGSTPTRKSFKFGGHRYRRTSRGNLIQSKHKSSTPCRFYTKTGRCNRALTCPYAHIPDRLAICPRFLRATCPNTADSCPLSHKPSAHNTPSCVHFQATSTCRNGSDCIYPHVRVAANAPVCEAFARGGWCDKPPGTCGELHAWECQEFREKGSCSRAGKCGLRHVLRAEREKEAETYHLPVAKGSFEDNTDFVNLEVGSPPDVSEQESEDNEGSASETSSGESDEGSDDDAEEMLGVVV